MRTVLALLTALVAGEARAVGPDTPVEELLGRHGREQLAHQLEERRYGGKAFPWERWARWGRGLLVKGSVDDPPLGPAPSPRLSKSYRCVHCHSLVREDPRPGVPDPEAREALLRAAVPSHPERRDGSFPALLPGTTFAGAVNRTSFYNGWYERYRSLRVPTGERMNPRRLADAVQVCSRYCSAGRYLEPWEMDSVLAALWELELEAKDLDLSPGELARAAAGDEAGRELLRSRFLPAARADLLPKARDVDGDALLFEDGRRVAGDAERGALLFAASCGGCHGGDVAAPSPAKLARRAAEDAHFARAPLRGTERLGGLYMPLFTAQRLSPRQIADIREYLRSGR